MLIRFPALNNYRTSDISCRITAELPTSVAGPFDRGVGATAANPVDIVIVQMEVWFVLLLAAARSALDVQPSCL
jgi:hypothetical protein